MEKKQEQPKKNIEARTIRTFSSDMAEAVRENQISVIKIAMAEKERREQQEESQRAGNSKSSKVLFFIGSLIFIAGAIFGSYYLINQKKARENLIVKEKPRIGTFINYENAIIIDSTKINSLMSLISVIHSKEPEEKNGSNALFFMQKNETGGEQQISKNDLLSILKSTAPDSLNRSMSQEFLFGKYKGGLDVGGSSAFLIFGINDYSLAYASMLDWEKSMFNDLFILFDITISDSDSALFEKEWRDIIINNKDARVLYGLNGEGILYYSFVNKNILVVTENAEVLKRMINAILVKNPQ